jgi:hypothetical protein
VLVCLDDCASGVVLRAGAPDRDLLFRRLYDGLAEAQKPKPTFVTGVVRRRNSNDIIYVELVQPVKEADCLKVNTQPPQLEIVRALQPVSRESIDAVAASLAGLTCAPNAISPQCIPFTYVYSYCWFRAHLMCLALQRANIQSAKLWAFAKSPVRLLKVPTDCLPECVTSWRFHVVPVACADQFDLRVIDPSLFGTRSVPLSTFLDLMRPVPHFVYTDMTAYRHSFGSTPAGVCASTLQKNTLEALAGLELTKSFPEGPPPYKSCRI